MLPMSYTVHPSAIVDEGAQIGAGSRVWHFAHVCAGARIGQGVSLGQNVFVGNKVVIGNQCKVQNNVSVYDNVTLEDGVFCGPSMVFTNVYNPRALVERKNEYRNTLVKKGATLGANCTIVCGTTVGEYAFVGAGAVINKDVPAYALMVGVPAKQVGWMSEFGEKLNLPCKAKPPPHARLLFTCSKAPRFTSNEPTYPYAVVGRDTHCGRSSASGQYGQCRVDQPLLADWTAHRDRFVGRQRAEYGKQVVAELARQLTTDMERAAIAPLREVLPMRPPKSLVISKRYQRAESSSIDAPAGIQRKIRA
jgi:UDP-2-acetamido-3-amino-2,3-dideoxy-glucuronate N-acetyltransferase